MAWKVGWAANLLVASAYAGIACGITKPGLADARDG